MKTLPVNDRNNEDQEYNKNQKDQRMLYFISIFAHNDSIEEAQLILFIPSKSIWEEGSNHKKNGVAISATPFYQLTSLIIN